MVFPRTLFAAQAKQGHSAMFCSDRFSFFRQTQCAKVCNAFGIPAPIDRNLANLAAKSWKIHARLG